MSAPALALWPEEAPCFKVERNALTVSQWAARHRELDPLNCSTPGRWRNETTPYLVGIMDAFSDPHCRELTLMGGTQWGKTESEINMLGWLVDVSPRPTMFVLPTEEDVVSFGNRRLRAAVDYSPKLAAHKTEHAADWKNTEIQFDSMPLYLGWAGSPTRLAMRSLGAIIFDECAKYADFTGEEADPISLGKERLRWWFDSKLVRSSTPKVPNDHICRAWSTSDRRAFHLPCPYCGVFQPLRFSRETVVWPSQERDPARIRALRLAAYRCQACRREIPDDTAMRQRMMLGGVWCPDGDRVDVDGTVRGPVALHGPHRGFHVNALYSPRLTWSDVAAEFLESKDDTAKLLNFRNSWEGLPWEQRSATTSVDVLSSRQDADLPRGSVPTSAVVLTAGVDVQDDRLYWSVHAWATAERNWTVDYGVAFSWEQVVADVLDRRFPVCGEQRELDVRMTAIDSQGHRTDEVASFVLEQLQRTGAERVRAIKGYDQRPVPLTAVRWQRDIRGKPCGLQLWLTDVSYFKDKLQRFLTAVPGTPGSWRPHAAVDDGYLEHLTAEHKVLITSQKKGRRRRSATSWAWTARPGAPNHWWDTAVYAAAAADMLLVYTLRDEGGDAPPRPNQPNPPAPPAPAGARGGFVRSRSIERAREGWMRRR